MFYDFHNSFADNVLRKPIGDADPELAGSDSATFVYVNCFISKPLKEPELLPIRPE